MTGCRSAMMVGVLNLAIAIHEADCVKILGQ